MNTGRLLTVEEISKGIRNHSPSAVMKETHLSYATVLKLKSGKEGNYTMSTLMAASDYIFKIKQELDQLYTL
jgi:hypothetical protein